MKLVKFLIKTVLVLLIIVISIILFRAFSSIKQADLMAWNTIKPEPELLLNNSYSSFKEFVKADQEYIKTNFQKIETSKLGNFNKYNPKGISYPLRDGNNYNASFILDPGKNNTKGIIVLTHGLSDSPYHIYNLGQYFLKKGYYVFGLRMPGHGTLPSGLLNVTWQDWYKAVEWSMKTASELAKSRNNIPVSMGGFSTGGSLSIHYCLKAATDNSLEMPEKVFLFSPAAGVSELGVIGAWHKSLSWINYFKKFAWLDILPEYDPAKYMSFTKNAGRQVFLLCEENKIISEKIKEKNLASKLPSFISFESWVDATVNIDDLVDLYSTVGDVDDLLVIFDVNHKYDPFMRNSVINNSPKNINLEKNNDFSIHIITNKTDSLGNNHIPEVGIFPLVNGNYGDEIFSDTITVKWPDNYYAISHICVPIAPNNKLYGKESFLNKLQIHGERQVLLITSEDIDRIRYNPFFELMKKELNKFIEK
ncbi:MAG: hypothetical protein DRI86_15435 [Bacteroidetes bacterium]|nr:MAG: hypothetical protein DRI86_15435 [Bacteroidota bacterium]